MQLSLQESVLPSILLFKRQLDLSCRLLQGRLPLSERLLDGGLLVSESLLRGWLRGGVRPSWHGWLRGVDRLASQLSGSVAQDCLLRRVRDSDGWAKIRVRPSHGPRRGAHMVLQDDPDVVGERALVAVRQVLQGLPLLAGEPHIHTGVPF